MTKAFSREQGTINEDWERVQCVWWFCRTSSLGEEVPSTERWSQMKLIMWSLCLNVYLYKKCKYPRIEHNGRRHILIWYIVYTYIYKILCSLVCLDLTFRFCIILIARQTVWRVPKHRPDKHTSHRPEYLGFHWSGTSDWWENWSLLNKRCWDSYFGGGWGGNDILLTMFWNKVLSCKSYSHFLGFKFLPALLLVQIKFRIALSVS